jgi:dipeptidase
MKNIVLAIIIAMIGYSSSNACTNLLVSKGAAADGSTLITYAADAGGFMERLFYLPEADHEEGEMLEVYDWDTGKYLGEIKQAKHTYRVVGNMNQHQLTIGETTFTGLDKYRDTTGIIDYGSLIRITLQRAKTAREAIKVIDELTSEYGYYSTGESFSIADPNEVWVMDLHPKGVGNKGIVWVARRIPDGYIAAHANQSRIRKIIKNDPDNCLYSDDVISFAEKEGIAQEYNGEFSYADTYNPLDPGGALYCEGRVWRFYDLAAPSQNLSEDYWRAVEGAEPYPLFIRPDKKISVKDLQTWMRDHFEGTEYDMTKGLAAGPYGCPYRWKNLSWKLEGDTTKKFGWERPISTQQTAWSFVAQMRSELPDEIGGVLWYGVDDAATSCYVPLYSSLQSPPKPYTVGSIKDFTWESMFWVFNLVANKAYTMYSYISEDVKEVQQNYEDKFLSYQPELEKAALGLYKTNPELAADFLSDYSISNAERVHKEWKSLWEYLVVKYNDRYVNDVTKNGGRSPEGVGYEQKFLEQVVKERPGYYDVEWKQNSN